MYVVLWTYKTNELMKFICKMLAFSFFLVFCFKTSFVSLSSHHFLGGIGKGKILSI